MRLPLVGLEMVVDMLPAGLSSAGALHVAVLVVRPETVADRYWIFDFLPIEPLKQETILNIVAGRPVKAQTRNRVVTKSAPLKRCKLIGPSLHGDTIQVAKSFQEDWPKLLAVGKMDCRHHAKALIKELTGVEVDYIV